jgi:predicted RNA-binding Zn-ribbon protein involved in translation (DUF1610 family)
MAATEYTCEDCDWSGTLEDMEQIQHVDERVSVGELMAAGECPDCGALIGVDDADVPEHTLLAVSYIMRARGWTVTEPAK